MHKLPELEYAFAALEPHIDAQTMEIHHDKHHGTYVEKLNAALEGHKELQDMSIEQLMASISTLPEEIRTAVRNNGGGHYNHTMFWNIMTPADEVETKPNGELASALVDAFGSYSDFQAAFKAAALARFGSGWTWLIKKSDGKVAVVTTPNQDNPIMDVAEEKGLPLLGLDVWEHAYYLKFQNKRADYIDAWWNVVDWAKVQEKYEA